MFRPFLLVGIGGSGGKTLRTLREDLNRRLREAGWSEPFPRAWQMVHIDVPTTQDGDDPDLPAQLPIDNYQGLVARGISCRNLDDTLFQHTGSEARDGLAGWRPEPREVAVPVDKGAGQYRALGRLISLASLTQIKAGLQHAMVNLQAAEVPGELGSLSRKFGAEASVSVDAPTAVVIASIAGGSGAGALIDVCDALRALSPTWGDHSIGILFAPDVFDEIPAELRKGVRPNALATLSELLAGYWNTDGPTATDDALLALGGIAAPNATRLGPRYPMLVGKRNSKVDFGTQNDVYKAMGRALGAWLTSDTLQDSLGAYMQANWTAASHAVHDALPLKTSTQETPFAAIGFARVTLGRDRFRQYAAEALARQAVEHVLRRHVKDRNRDDDRSDDELLVERVEYSFGPFLVGSGLDERGRERNDVLVALTPQGGRKGRLQRLSTQITEQVRAAAGDQPRDRRWWRDRIVAHVRELERSAIREDLDEVEANARTWVVGIQDRITRLVSMTIAAEGAPATARMLRKLSAEVDAVLHELPGEIESFGRVVNSAQQEVDAVLARGNAAQLPASHGNVPPAVDEAVKLVRREAEISTRHVAIELLRDLDENVIQPLAEAVADGYQRLLQEEGAKTDGRPSEVKAWPLGDDVPPRLGPSRNEHLLEPVAQFPTTLETLARRTTGVDDVGGAVRQAVSQVVSGSIEPDGAGQRLVVRSTDWIPRRPQARETTHLAPTRARFEVRLSAQALLKRAYWWIGREDTAIGRYVNESLREYLDESLTEPGVFHKRLVKFEGDLQAALDSAEPLVQINSGVLAVVHNKTSAAHSVNISGLPFPERSKAYDVAMNVLVSRGVRDEDARRAFREIRTGHVDVFATLSEPYQPVVFDSVMLPLAEEWKGRNGDADGRSAFWRWRRARPLPQFVPVAPHVRVAMVRGWFTARILGQLRMGDDGRSSVLVPGTGRHRWMDFPFPTLRTARVNARYDWLPVVLESMPLAFLVVNLEAKLTAMEPYGRLRALGTAPDGGLERYDEPNAELERWIRDGTVPEGAYGTVPEGAYGTVPEGAEEPIGAGAQPADMAVRQTAVLERLQKLEARYEGLFERTEHRSEFNAVPMVWEIRDDVRTALGDLSRAVGMLKGLADDAAW